MALRPKYLDVGDSLDSSGTIGAPGMLANSLLTRFPLNNCFRPSGPIIIPHRDNSQNLRFQPFFLQQFFEVVDGLAVVLDCQLEVGFAEVPGAGQVAVA